MDNRRLGALRFLIRLCGCDGGSGMMEKKALKRRVADLQKELNGWLSTANTLDYERKQLTEQAKSALAIRTYLEDRDHQLQFGDTCRDTHKGCEIALRTVYLIAGGMEAKAALKQAQEE